MMSSVHESRPGPSRRAFRRSSGGLGCASLLKQTLGRDGKISQHIADIIDNRLDAVEIVALPHDPDERLGPRQADDETPAIAELPAAILDRPNHPLVLQGLP